MPVKLTARFTGMSKFGDYLGVVYDEDGNYPTKHTSSSIQWLKNDLGFEKHPMDDGNMFQHKRLEFDKLYGEGNWTITWEEPEPAYQDNPDIDAIIEDIPTKASVEETLENMNSNRNQSMWFDPDSKQLIIRYKVKDIDEAEAIKQNLLLDIADATLWKNTMDKATERLKELHTQLDAKDLPTDRSMDLQYRIQEIVNVLGYDNVKHLLGAKS